ncbi:hypothetical protein, partial [Enterococcus avium]|uniref:hypothetical protein n=1 Tax=Enterococcus avium TaxID=33945 RepID=UPI000FC05DBB
LATWLWKGKEPLFFCSKFRKKSDKKTSQTQITSSRRLLSTVWHFPFFWGSVLHDLKRIFQTI